MLLVVQVVVSILGVREDLFAYVREELLGGHLARVVHLDVSRGRDVRLDRLVDGLRVVLEPELVEVGLLPEVLPDGLVTGDVLTVNRPLDRKSVV